MKIQLITIGNELLNGKTQDRNAFWLANFCHEHNLSLDRIHVIPDKESAFLKAFEQAWQDADLVICSGGLGPTKDDLTKGMLAKFFKKELVESSQAMEITKKNYQKSKREYNPRQEYSKIPEGFKAVYNKVGYAPGLLFCDNQKMAAALPGVPSEFKTMFMEEIFRESKKVFPDSGKQKKHIIIKTWKIPEVKIFDSLCPNLWEDLAKFGEVSSLPNPLGVDIGVSVEAAEPAQMQLLEQAVKDAVLNSPLKERIWHIGKESLEEVIVKKAQEKKMIFGFAESCTGGLCASRITDIPGSSRVFVGSVVCYANEVKEKVLNVNATTLEKYGAVSSETAWEMAQGARNALGADLVVTTTGIAGPGGGSSEKPVGTIGVGYSSERDCAGNLHHFPEMDREDLKRIFSQLALVTLLEQIELY